MANSESLFTVTATPTVGTGVAYTSGDTCGTVMTLSNVGAFPGDEVYLENMVVISKVVITTPIFIGLFFNALPTVASADNAAIDISDAEMAAKFQGQVFTVTGQTVTLASGVVARTTTGIPVACASDSRDIYCQLVVNATPTFTSTTDLTCLFTFRRYVPFQYAV